MKERLELERYVRGNVDAKLLELIELRASTRGGTPAVTEWSESTLLTDRERAALALADAVTDIGVAGVPDDVWREGRKHWSERELADITLAIIAINAWSRIAVAARRAKAEDRSQH